MATGSLPAALPPSPPPRAAPAVGRPPAGDAVLLAVAVTALSSSGPLIAATAVPSLAIAFWRNALATGALLPVAAGRGGRELAGLSRRHWALALGSGMLLAAHFGTWVPSVTMTSIASSTALVCATPVWNGLLAHALGQHIPARAWVGIAVSLASVAVLTGVDFSLSRRALAGDLLALTGGALIAGYMTIGAQLRRDVSTATYTLVCYGCASVLLLAVSLAGHQAVWGYDGSAWLKLAALTAGPQLLGHTVINRVLQTTSPTVVSLAVLFEVPGAALIASIWLNQRPPLAVVPAAVLLLTGIALVVSARTPPPQPSG